MTRRLLLVEDDRPVLIVTAELLKRTGCEIVTADSAPAAIARLQHEKFDLLVTDFFLGDRTAEEVIKTLRAAHPSVPIIVVTGDIDSVPEWIKQPGVVEQIFSKPFSSAQLVRAVSDALEPTGETQAKARAAAPEPVDFRLPKGIEEMVHRAVDDESIVAITDKKGSIVYANDRFCEISGYSRSELLGRNHRLLKSDQHPPAFYKTLWGTILSGRVWRGEICNKAKDGHLYFVDTIISPLRSEGLITHFLALRTDITAKKEIEKELIRQHQREEEDRRMTALGRMANGFLHDLNNVLTGVMGIATEASGAARDAMLQDAISRMAQLTRTLRDYSAGRPSKVESFPLNPLLSCACSLVRHRKGAPPGLSIVEQTTETRKVEVVGCEAQIFEVVLNLVINAMEAVAEVPSPRVVLHASRAGRDVVITVEDNGPGVPLAVADNIFEPYTSSKGAGRGIGLSVARSIATAHNGNLQLESAGGDGKGARFRFTLPARETAPAVPVENATPAGPRRIVLVSEDEVDVRRLITRSASEIGLTVMSAGDTADLLALAAQMKEVLAAAIIDNCEVESEQGAVACLRRISPDLPIILISAKLTTRGRSSTPWGEVENIPKPFEGEALQRALTTSVSRTATR
ncbi:MAG: response regulator [Nibricoccus sp.]